jgi:small-conductance mechanosensitive channel
VLLGLCAAHPNVLQDPPAQAVVTGLSDTAVELTLIARASSYATQWGAETQLRERAYQAFLEHGISAPVPRRIVQVQEQQAHPA